MPSTNGNTDITSSRSTLDSNTNEAVPPNPISDMKLTPKESIHWEQQPFSEPVSYITPDLIEKMTDMTNRYALHKVIPFLP